MSGVLLRALFGATLKQTAAVLGVGRATVARLQTTFRKKRPAGPNPSRNWGGRRQSLLTAEEEGAFLKPWLESAATGSLVVVSPIRAALAQRLAKSPSTWSVPETTSVEKAVVGIEYKEVPDPGE